MKVLVLQGSYRKDGHTKQLSEPFMDELRRLGAEVEEEWLCDREIKPCQGCGACQEHIGELGCIHQDDFELLFNKIRLTDLIVFASPIYSGSAPGPVKTFMDRLIYAPVKAYGTVKGPSLLAGKACAILMTSGYNPKTMVVPFETCMKLLAHKTEMDYLGWVGGTDPGKAYIFMNEKKAQRARDFAAELMQKLSDRAAANA